MEKDADFGGSNIKTTSTTTTHSTQGFQSPRSL